MGEKDKEEIKMIALKSYCAFYPNPKLNDNIKFLNPLGVFVSTDWYLNENQLNYLRLKFEDADTVGIVLDFDCDCDTINLHHGFKTLAAEAKANKKEDEAHNKEKNIYNFSK